MPDHDNNINRNRIEDIKRHLYDQQDSTSNRFHDNPLHQISHKVPESWQSKINQDDDDLDWKKMNKPRMSGFKKFFIGSVIFFVGAIGFATYMFMKGGVSVSSDNINIAVIGNAFTKGGDELPLQVEITNHNKADLELSDLLVEYPSGASDDPNAVVRIPRDSIGTIGAGQSVTRNIKVSLFGQEGSVRDVKLTLEYHPGTSNAIFTKEKDYPVTINSAPLSLTINAPDQATSGQAITLNVMATLNTALPSGHTIIQATYPSDFVFDSAIPSPDISNNVWSMDNLSLTNPLSIAIKGHLVGQNGDQQVFHVYAGAPSNSDQSTVNVVYNSLLQNITIQKPFLEAHILVNNQDMPVYTANGGDTINAQVNWVNNLSTQVTNAQIIVSFSGNAFDKTAVNPLEGYYDSLNNQIIWDQNSDPDLVSVQPGASGTVSFNFKPMSLIGLATPINQPEVTMSVSIKGTQPSDGSTFNEIDNSSNKIVKILSDLQLAVSAAFYSGSMPPKAETTTQYLVTWTLSNSANPITGAQARSVLPIYINWVGPQAGSTENVSYNQTTREVVWNIGSINPNTGFTSNREASFIVSLTPSLSQVGSVPQLMGEVDISGTDSFTKTLIQNTRGAITTSLSNDPNFKTGDERVTN